MVRCRPRQLKVNAALQPLHIVDIPRVHVHTRTPNRGDDSLGQLGRVKMNRDSLSLSSPVTAEIGNDIERHPRFRSWE
jgi:hypothetical protein